MIVSAVAAMDRAGLIGDGLTMPWHLPRDLKRFRRLTLGKPIILGRRTFESIGKPLDGRLNIVLTRNPSFAVEGVQVARDVDEALAFAETYVRDAGGDEAMVIGGGVVFEETLPRWDRLLLTIVEGTFRGDAYFPVRDVLESRWRLAGREYCEADPRNPHPQWFLTLDKPGPDDPPAGDFDLAGWLGGTPESFFRSDPSEH